MLDQDKLLVSGSLLSYPIREWHFSHVDFGLASYYLEDYLNGMRLDALFGELMNIDIMR